MSQGLQVQRQGYTQVNAFRRSRHPPKRAATKSIAVLPFQGDVKQGTLAWDMLQSTSNEAAAHIILRAERGKGEDCLASTLQLARSARRHVEP